jgi:uncharacterized protein YndB with AHSA1/START domain
MTTAQSTSAGTRSIERALEIHAPIERVWAALTRADELMKWFPLQATVTPGVGGTMHMAWNEYFEGEATIEVWEPNAHLRTTFMEPGGTDEPIRTLVDYHLEAKGGSTILRLVHSGISADESWDDLYDGIRRGWRAELCSLRHYLERHDGVARRVAWARMETSLSENETWDRVTGVNGLRIRGDLCPGDRFAAISPSGEELVGTIILSDPPRQLCATVETLGDSYLRLELDKCGEAASPSIWMWLATYGLQEGFVADLEKRWSKWLAGLLAD